MKYQAQLTFGLLIIGCFATYITASDQQSTPAKDVQLEVVTTEEAMGWINGVPNSVRKRSFLVVTDGNKLITYFVKPNGETYPANVRNLHKDFNIEATPYPRPKE